MVNIQLNNGHKIMNKSLLKHAICIFGTLLCSCWCESCVRISGKLKIRTNYGQLVIDCFVSIACDCDVTVLGPLPSMAWPISIVHNITTAVQLIQISWTSSSSWSNAIQRELGSTLDLGSADPRSWTTLVQRAVNLTPVDRYMDTMSCIFLHLLHLLLTTLLLR